MHVPHTSTPASWRPTLLGTRSARSARRLSLSRSGVPQPTSGPRNPEPLDYHFSYYSLAHADAGVCIDMTSGQVRFDWAYVPFGEMPRAFAIFARRLHFRSGHHVDEPVRQMQVPRRPLQAI